VGEENQRKKNDIHWTLGNQRVMGAGNRSGKGERYSKRSNLGKELKRDGEQGSAEGAKNKEGKRILL